MNDRQLMGGPAQPVFIVEGSAGLSTQPEPGNTPSLAAIQTATGSLAPNAGRKVWFVQNLGTNVLFIKFGAGASSSDFHIALKAGTANDDGNGGFISDEIYKGLVSIGGTSPRYSAGELS